MQILQQFGYTHAGVERMVVVEMQFGNMPEAHAFRQLMPEKRRHFVQSDHIAVLSGFIGIQYSDIDFRRRQIFGEHHFIDGDKANPRIVHLSLQNRRQLFLHLRCYALAATKLFRHGLYFPFNFNTFEYLNMVAGLHIVVIFYADTAFHAHFNFIDIVFKAAQGFQLSFVYDHVVA